MRGGAIDFTKSSNPENDEEGGKETDEVPTISGAFLSSLWSGALTPADKVLPALALIGLRIEGRVSLAGVRQRRSAGETVPRLVAQKCDFADVVDLGDAPIAQLSFSDCTFCLADPPRAPVPALSLVGAEIRGSINFARCTFGGNADLRSARMGRALGFQDCRIAGRLVTAGMTIGGALTFTRVTVTGGRAALDCTAAQVDGHVSANSVRCEGPVMLDEVSAPAIRLQKVSAHSDSRRAALSLHAAKSGGIVSLRNIRCVGTLIAGSLQADGLVSLVDISVRPRGTDDGLLDGGHILLSDMRCKSSIRIRSVIAKAQALGLRNAHAEDQIDIREVKLGSLIAADASASEVILYNGKIDGAIQLDRLKVKADCKMANLSCGQRQILPEIDSKTNAGSDLQAWHMVIGRSLFMTNLVVQGRLVLGGTRISNILRLQRVGAVKGNGLFSADFQDVSVGTAFEIRESGFANGASLLGVKCLSLAVSDSYFRSCDDKDDDHPAFRGIDMAIGSDVWIGRKRDRDGSEPGNRFDGILALTNSSVGKSIRIRDGRFSSHTEGSEDPGVHAHALVMNKARVNGDISIGPIEVSGKMEKEALVPLEIDGCISVDGAQVGGKLRLDNATVRPVGTPSQYGERPGEEDRLSGRKRGVALSMLDTRISGAFALGTPTLGGIVDLRDSQIGRLRDDGGRGWASAGIKPGDLLLDGLGYGDLDEPETTAQRSWVQRTRDALLGRSGSGEAQARLDWIEYQYAPDQREFSPQPYEQLAHYFSENGDERARRHVLVAKRERQRKSGGLGLFERALGWVLKATSNYGYSPARAIIWLLVYFGFGALVAWALGSAGAIQPNSTDMVSPYPYNYLVLAIDAAIPIIDLEHDSMLTINPAALPEWASQSGILIGKAIYEILGMLLLSIAVLTLTGTLREKE